MLKMKRGDTIVEVIFAFAVFGFVAISSITIMRQSMARAQTALEINLVRNQMNAQAEALRFIHQAALIDNSKSSSGSTSGFTGAWTKIINRRVAKLKPLSELSNQQGVCAAIQSVNSQAFILNTRDANLKMLSDPQYFGQASTYSRLMYGVSGENDSNEIDLSTNVVKSEGLWIEVLHQPSTAKTKGYYDFHIRSCWLSPSQGNPVTLETIVRLYDFK